MQNQSFFYRQKIIRTNFDFRKIVKKYMLCYFLNLQDNSVIFFEKPCPNSIIFLRAKQC